MGIRFFCPNGHRLNVKSYLAGKKGICPHCGEKLRIPATTDPRAERAAGPSDEHHQGAGEEDEISTFITEQDGSSASAALQEPARGSGTGVEVEMRGDKRTSPPPSPALSSQDPIATAGDAVWYVRHRDGSQYGPADPTSMRQWLDEGRIGPDSMVWNQRWSDWKTAAEVFPKLSERAGDEPTNDRSSDAPPAATLPAAARGSGTASDGALEPAKDDSPEIRANDPKILLAMQRKLRKRRSAILLGALVVIALSLGAVATFIAFR